MPKSRSSKRALPDNAYEPTDGERQLVKQHLDRRRQSARAPRVKLKHQPPEPVEIEPDHPEHRVGNVALHEAFGTAEAAFVQQQLVQLIDATHGDTDAPVSEGAVNGALAAIKGIDPKDEVEAMVAAHHLAMDLARRTRQTHHLNPMNVSGNLAVKFMRSFNAQLEALQRYRGKEQQKIVVERVNVSDGGQAIVGSVEHGGTGGGSQEKSEGQSHAKQQHADASKPEMRSENETRNAVSSTGTER